MEHHEFWQKLESFLRNYERAYAPVRWFRDWGGLTKEREGYFVFLKFVFLVGLYVVAFYVPLYAWPKIPLTFIATYLIADMFVLATSFAFGGIVPMRPLRAMVFVFISYISICIAFGLLYVTLCRSSFSTGPPNFFDLMYFSGTTTTGLGIGDITPLRHTVLVKFLVVSELLIGLYFWAVLVGTVISLAVREVKSERNFPR